MKLVLQIAAGLVLAVLIISLLPSMGYVFGYAVGILVFAGIPLAMCGLLIWGMVAAYRYLKRQKATPDRR
jgi:hypothetical protein